MPAKSKKGTSAPAQVVPPPAPAPSTKSKAASKAKAKSHAAAPVEAAASESGSGSDGAGTEEEEEEEEEEVEVERDLPKPAPRSNKRQQAAAAAAAAAAEEESESGEGSDSSAGSSDSEDEDEDEDEEDEEDEEPVAVAASMLRGRGGSSSSASASASAEARGFQSMSKRMLAAGKASSGNLASKYVGPAATGASAGKGKGKHGAAFVVESTFQKNNPIEAAQAKSSLYSADGASAGSLQKQKEERTKTLGKGWFDIAPAKLDEGLRADMKIVQMRNYLDPKRFYKNPDKMKAVIGVGTVIEGREEYTTQRLTKKERKQSLVGEILADKSIKDYTKRKYSEIQKEKEHNSRKKKKMGQRMGVGSGARKIRKLY